MERLAHALALEERAQRRPAPPPAWAVQRDEYEYHEDAAGARAFADHQHQIAERQMAAWEHGGADPATDPRNDPAVERVLGPRPQGPLAPEPPEPLRPQRQPYVDPRGLGRRPGTRDDWVRSAPPRPERMKRPPPAANDAEALERLRKVVAGAPWDAPHSRIKRVFSILERLRREGLAGDLRGRAAWLRRATELGIEDFKPRKNREKAARLLLGSMGLVRVMRELRRLRDAGLPLVEPVPVPKPAEPSPKAVAIANGVPADWHIGGPGSNRAL
jgi:hypothetical protein